MTNTRPRAVPAVQHERGVIETRGPTSQQGLGAAAGSNTSGRHNTGWSSCVDQATRMSCLAAATDRTSSQRERNDECQSVKGNNDIGGADNLSRHAMKGL